jgi:pilus assembly protein TadC
MMTAREILRFVASALKERSRIFAILEMRIADAARFSGLGFAADEWVSLAIVLACSSLVLAAILFSLVLPLAHAVGLAIITGFSAGLCAYAYPFLVAGRNARAMEAELPMFIARLLSIYAERRNMASALNTVVRFYDGRLVEKVRNGYVLFLAGAPADEAFSELTDYPGLRYTGRAFKLIAKSLETGLDVGEALNDVARSASASVEYEAEKESKVGLVSWVISASSAFFFPLFAALGLVVMGVLEGIATASPYSENEKGVIVFAIFYYLVAGVVLDAGYNGRIRFDSFVKGVLAFAAPLCLLAVFVFVSTFKLANLFTGH